MVLYLVVGSVLTVFVFDGPHWEIDMTIDEDRVTTDSHWMSQILNILLWPYVAWKQKEEDDEEV